jgi:hypothetical protein
MNLALLTFGIKEKNMWRGLLSTVFEVVGFSALVVGVALFSVPISLIVGGALLIVAGGLSA